MRRKIVLILALSISMMAAAQDFGTYFTDRTLRLDYIFAGNAAHQLIALDQALSLIHI